MPVEKVQLSEDNDDDDGEENEAMPEEEVLNEIDVDEGIPYDERSNGNWTDTDGEDEGVIPLFDHEWGANVAKLQENGCVTCVDSFMYFLDDACIQKFVTATDNFGCQYFCSKWKSIHVNEFNTFLLPAILVLDLIIAMLDKVRFVMLTVS